MITEFIHAIRPEAASLSEEPAGFFWSRNQRSVYACLTGDVGLGCAKMISVLISVWY